MTYRSKILTLFLVELGLLGAAAFGGVALYRKRDPSPARLATCEKQLAENQKLRPPIVARGLLMESAARVCRGDHAIAFERTARAQIIAQQAGLGLDAAFDEVMGMLVTQDPLSRDALIVLADKVLPGPDSRRPDEKKPPPAKGQAQAPPPPARAVPPPPPAARVPEPAPTRPPAVDEAYRALLDAKTALLVGGAEAAQALPKVARARVMLNEAGRTELDSDLDAVLAALRRRDEAKARAGIDTILARLR